MAKVQRSWTEYEITTIHEMTMTGHTALEIGIKLNRTPGSVVTFCYHHGRPVPSRVGETSSEFLRPKLSADHAFKINAIAGLRHCKDLAEHHPYGFGELSIPPDGIPKRMGSFVDLRSMSGSSMAMCSD